MTFPCSKCGFEYDYRALDTCPRCADIRAAYPALLQYIEDCIEKTRKDERQAQWERDMGDDL